MALDASGITLAIIVATLAAIVYSLRVLVVMERRVAKMERHIDKPWGSEYIWSHTEKYTGKLLYITQGHKLSLQHHQVKDESIYVLKGILELTVGPELNNLSIIQLKKDESYRIQPGIIHRFSAPLEDVVLIEVSTSELDDVIRHQDDYGRQ